ncbi:ornithine--oxo-acid transaminase [Actinocorallia sp. A-T 12471]|uniref:ornithine--oxo-acid transaminase n=1 Tax=Actinocorallia sp. A-T 12471 TaxID=3089813 RepID=UPI0029D361B2|nr:ornithine--oxo-acid transaminase [Actinocorallia sp. A-T 12471]MDX6738657.1 ornithine--oxo-acid transaminase [Actinocorallia sp. A-T 12471]
MTVSSELRTLSDEHAAHTYHPLPVVIATAEGVWVTDADGHRYLDMLAAYSAVNFGHRNPRLTAKAKEQLDRVTLVSRAFEHDKFGPFVTDLAALCGKDMVLPMNSGAEGVETAIKTARKWGYEVKGVPADQANIIVFSGNFHGRTTTIISFSDDPEAHEHYGPYTPGFRTVPYGDIDAVRAAIDGSTVGVLVEPIQGEAGVNVPPDGFLRALRALCTEANVLMIDDEIQAGLGRAGDTFAAQHEDVVPDIYILGKALGGGIMPVSAVVADRDVLGVFQPGQHGSTFGGNPLACAIGREVVAILKEGTYQRHSKELGAYMHERLATFTGVASVSGRGLWAGLHLDRKARPVSERLMELGVLAKETHETTIRLAPPLSITREELDWALDQVETALADH